MIYLLEDDDSIRNFVTYALNSTGLPARAFARPSLFRCAMEEEKPQLILLDVMLPEEDGLHILRSLRANPETARIPVIMLTARSEEYDKVIALDAGADDYVSKPFGIMELIARIRAMLRRSGEGEARPKDIALGALYICPERHIVRADGREIALTLKEFELLALLAAEPGTVFTRDRILRAVWGIDFDGENRTVDVHIRTLRTKLGDCGTMIETVRGVGYRIASD